MPSLLLGSGDGAEVSKLERLFPRTPSSTLLTGSQPPRLPISHGGCTATLITESSVSQQNTWPGDFRCSLSISQHWILKEVI